jgi:hypothetical protein
MEAIVPGRLKHIYAARLHGRPCPVTVITEGSRNFTAFFAQVTGTGQEHEGFIISILEHIPFQVSQYFQEIPVTFSPVL